MLKQTSWILCCILLCNSTAPLSGQDSGKNSSSYCERLYISTDKPGYLAGEALWLSLFCFDAQTHQASALSKVAYIELQDAQKSVVQVKAALTEGRGSAQIALPLSLPTGNYRLVAYTRYMQNEGQGVFFTKIISVYNTLSTEKTTQDNTTGNNMSPNSQEKTAPASGIKPSINISPTTFPSRSAIPITVTNTGDQAISYSLSVYALDSLSCYKNPEISHIIATNTAQRSNNFSNKYIPDYEGEIIHGKIINAKTGAMEPLLAQTHAYISIPGSELLMYVGKPENNGDVSFFTKNIFGKKEIITEIFPRGDHPQQLVINNAFVEPKPTALPELPIDPTMENTLVRRSLSMQIGYHFFSDSVHAPVMHLSGTTLANSGKTYRLDDYTRFPLMKEVIIEFISEARFRTQNNKTVLLVRNIDAFGRVSIPNAQALVFLDGIPLFDHEKIYNYDPLLIESITVYEGNYVFGDLIYTGIVFFKSYKGNYQGITFDQDVRIRDFNGVQYPLQFIMPVYGNNTRPQQGSLPDWRHTLYWNANVYSAAGQEKKMMCYSSDYTGDFIAVIEGMSANGQAFRQECRFSVVP